MAERAASTGDNNSAHPTPPDGWTRCNLYMARKQRFCRQRRAPGGKFCGNHTFSPNRVPCPLDASHFVDRNFVEQHMKVCPCATRKQLLRNKGFYQHNINVGGHGCLDGNNSEAMTVESAHRLAFKILQVYQRVFSSSCSDQDTEKSSLRNVTLQSIMEAIPTLDLSEPEMEAGLSESIDFYRIKSGGARHVTQQASLVGHLRRTGVLEPFTGNTAIVEAGAGRGMLGLVVAGVMAARTAASTLPNNNVQLILVEKSGSRSKADTVLRMAKESTPYMALNCVKWSRIQCDLSHVRMPSVLGENDSIQGTRTVGTKRKHSSSKLVVIAKHLCGSGTDLALKSLRDIASELDACVMATCCHGVCNWHDYVGRDFLQKSFKHGEDGIEFGPAEFDLMRRWSSGTVLEDCSDECSVKEESKPANEGLQQSKTDDQDNEVLDHRVAVFDAVGKDPLNVSAVVQSIGLACGPQGLGRACQRLLDQGRCEYMRKVLLTGDDWRVELMHYVAPTVTPQNAVLIAHRVSKKKPEQI